MIMDFLFGIQPTWTLTYDDGSAAVSFDVFCEMEMKSENVVASEPLEKGSFASYNKQASPMELRCVLAMTGSFAEQQTALDTLEDLCSGTELLSLVTPQQEYPDLNLESYNYRRNETSGASLLTVELMLVEVRQVESAATTQATQQPISKGNAKNASNASKVDTGKMQTKKPYKSILKRGAEAVGA